MPLKDPEVRLAAEVDPRVHILQVQSPGAGAQAPSKKGAQSGSWHSPRQLFDGKLAGTNKAKVQAK
jgi:hypothetical protein